MRNEVPALLPLLRSNFQGDLLALLLLDPEAEHSLADIARWTSANVSVVHREVERLVLGGVATDRRVGKARLIRVDPGYELIAPLTELIMRSYGPLAVLQEILGRTTSPGLIGAYIFGSWAARYSGESGRTPRDVDVLLVGAVPRDLIFEIEREARARIGKDVNVTRIDPAEWEVASTPFVSTLRQRPLVEVPLPGAAG
jgi:hypothetical protein